MQEKLLTLSEKARVSVEKWINQMTIGAEEQFCAMHFAAFNGNLKIMKMLERFGGRMDLSNNQQINCMHFAA
jgi:ankyrin repeat protein